MTATTANPLVAGPVNTSSPLGGTMLLESLGDHAKALESGSWLEIGLASFGVAMDTAAAVMDPIGQLLAAGLGWLMEHLEPLKGWLNDLTGDPGAVAGFAATWDNVKTALLGAAEELQRVVAADLAEMSGRAVAAYGRYAGDFGAHVSAAAGAAGSVAGALRVCSTVVQVVHDLVRDALAELVGAAISWAAEIALTVGLGTPWVASQVATRVSSLATRVGTKVTEVITSVRSLKQLVEALKEALGTLARTLRGAKPGSVHAPDAPTVHAPDATGDLDMMGRRRDWADPAAHPQPPSRSPDAYLPAGDPVYHRPGGTAVGYDGRTMRNFDAVAPEPGYHDVVVHGERNGMFRPGIVGADGGDYPANFTHPAQIADAIRTNPHYDGGPVRLVSCHSGTVDPAAGVAPAAQQVADALGVPVMAPTNAVGVNRYGPLGQVPQIRDGGTWEVFRPGGGQ